MKYIVVLCLFAAMTAEVFADMTVVQRITYRIPETVKNLIPAQWQNDFKCQDDFNITMSIKGQKARIDFSDGAFEIIDLKEGKQYIIFDQRHKEIIALDVRAN